MLRESPPWLISAVLHMIVLLGYVTTLCLATRRGHPLGPVLEEEVARPGTVPVAA